MMSTRKNRWRLGGIVPCVLALLGLGCGVNAIADEQVPEDELEQPLRTFILLQSQGFTHPVVNPGSRPTVVEQVYDEIASNTPGLIEHTVSFDATELDEQRLAETDLVIFYTTGNLPFAEGQYEAFDQWMRDGGLFLGTHSATDTMKGNETFISMIGGRFQSHPWNSNDTVTIKVQDEDHPATQAYAPRATFQEEIYQFDPFHYEDVRVLISLDMERTDKKRPYHIPIAWAREYGEGRVFYTSLGHNEHVWRSEEFQDHLTEAIRWLAGLREGSAEPNPELHELENERAERAAG